MYDACALGYLVTLLSVSNRRSRIFSRSRAARSREARVEESRQKHQNAPGGLGGELPCGREREKKQPTTTWEKFIKMTAE